VPDLYRPDGQFSFMGGVNPAGLIAWVVGGALALYFLTYAYIVGFVVAFVVYWVLMKLWIIPKYPQSELGASDGDLYLATSVGLNWVYTEDEGFVKMRTEDIPASAIAREDL